MLALNGNGGQDAFTLANSRVDCDGTQSNMIGCGINWMPDLTERH
jgi:hypothetical protein